MIIFSNDQSNLQLKSQQALPTTTPITTQSPNMSDAQIAGGHKAAINNPNVSKEAKEHSKKVLEEEFDGGNGKKSMSSHGASVLTCSVLVPKANEDMTGKNPGNVAGGLKA